ncbi:MAG: NAD-dependent epimerase/dehydratase family protein [Eubacterium sp.]|nr:NAD-dependent epimerase/dehydratase family protein [Eubacterium sp.]
MREIKNVIITGPTGAIGMALIQELLSRDINVTCVVNPDSKRIDRIKENDRVAMIKCDLKDIKSLSKVLDKERREGHSFPDRYDVFYHFAWMNTFGQGRDDIPSQMENVRYTMDAMDAAKDLGVRLFIGAGSQAEYGRSNEALRADTPAFPENGYGVAKLAAGQFGKIRAKQLGMEFIWTRILSVYGPYDGGGTLVQSMISKLKIGEVPETTKGEQIWDYLYSKDAARAFYLIARKGKNEKTYVIGSGEGRPLRSYIEDIRDVVCPGAFIDFGAIPYSEKQVMHLTADITELKEDTGFIPEMKFKEGIKSMM